MTLLVSSTLLLLGAGFRVWWNRLIRSSWRYRIGWTLLIAFVSLLSFVVALAINLSVRFAMRTGATEGINSLPGGLLNGVFLFTFVTGFGIALSALYLSSDLDLLMVAPIPLHSVFIAKLFQATLPTYLFVALPVIPSLWAFGLAMRYNPLYFLALFTVLAVLPLLPVALAALAVMAVVRVVPARRVAEILGLVAAVVSISFSLWGQGASAGTFRGMQPGAIFTAVRTLDIPYTPPSLAGAGLVALGTGNWGDAAREIGAFVALSLAGFVIALDVGVALYYSGWAKMRSGEGRRKGRTTREQVRPASSVFDTLLAHPVAAIVIKDFRSIPRDLSNLVQILSPLVFSVFWAWQLLRFPTRGFGGGLGSGFGGSLGILWPMASTVAAVTITGMIFSRFALTGVNREGKAVWIIRAAPISPWDWLWAKFLVVYLPFMALGAVLSLGFAVVQNSDLWSTLQGLVAVGLVGAGVTGISLGTGAMAARFDWSSPHQMVGLAPGCVSAVIYSAYAGVVLLIFVGARLLASSLPDVAPLVWAGALALTLLLTLAAVLVPLGLAAERLQSIE